MENNKRGKGRAFPLLREELRHFDRPKPEFVAVAVVELNSAADASFESFHSPVQVALHPNIALTPDAHPSTSANYRGVTLEAKGNVLFIPTLPGGI